MLYVVVHCTDEAVIFEPTEIVAVIEGPDDDSAVKDAMKEFVAYRTLELRESFGDPYYEMPEHGWTDDDVYEFVLFLTNSLGWLVHEHRSIEV